VDIKDFKDEKDFRIYTAYIAEFDFKIINGKLELILMVDTKSIIEQSITIHDTLQEINKSGKWGIREQIEAKKCLIGSSISTSYDKKNYVAIDIDFTSTCETKMIDDYGISHLEYFNKKKGIPIMFPGDPLIVTNGRKNKKNFFPPELLHPANISRKFKEIPKSAILDPGTRMEKIKRFLEPGAQKTKGLEGLLPSIGIQLKSDNIIVPYYQLEFPLLEAHGIKVCSFFFCDLILQICISYFVFFAKFTQFISV
jgi:hypothetical protein